MIVITPIERAIDAQHVKRWAIVGTVAQSTVASHSFSVAVIAMAIAKELESDINIHSLCYFAMLHDMQEVNTGDIPTPTKRAVRAAGVDINSLVIDYPLEEAIPQEMDSIIKCADLIENYTFILENAVGRRAALAIADVQQRMVATINEQEEPLRMLLVE